MQTTLYLNFSYKKLIITIFFKFLAKNYITNNIHIYNAHIYRPALGPRTSAWHGNHSATVAAYGVELSSVDYALQIRFVQYIFINNQFIYTQ